MSATPFIKTREKLTSRKTFFLTQRFTCYQNVWGLSVLHGNMQTPDAQHSNLKRQLDNLISSIWETLITKRLTQIPWGWLSLGYPPTGCLVNQHRAWSWQEWQQHLRWGSLSDVAGVTGASLGCQTAGTEALATKAPKIRTNGNGWFQRCLNFKWTYTSEIGTVL